MIYTLLQKTSDIYGCSLIRASSNFAFFYSTIQDVLVQNSMIPSPLDNAMSTFASSFGPFGSIDLRYVTYTANIATFCKLVHHLNSRALLSHNFAQTIYYKIPLSTTIYSTPLEWISSDIYFAGGNLFCEGQPAIISFDGMYGMFASAASCMTPMSELLNLERRAIVFAWTAMNVLSSNITTDVGDMCDHGMDPEGCKSLTLAISAYYKSFIIPILNSTEIALIAEASQLEIAALSIQYFQYAVNKTDTNYDQVIILRKSLLTIESRSRFVD